MRKRTPIVVQDACHITQSSTWANRDRIRRLVNLDGLEATHVDDKGTVLAAETPSDVTVSSATSGDIEALRGTCEDYGADLLGGRWVGNSYGVDGVARVI